MIVVRQPRLRAHPEACGGAKIGSDRRRNVRVNWSPLDVALERAHGRRQAGVLLPERETLGLAVRERRRVVGVVGRAGQTPKEAKKKKEAEEEAQVGFRNFFFRLR